MSAFPSVPEGKDSFLKDSNLPYPRELGRFDAPSHTPLLSASSLSTDFENQKSNETSVTDQAREILQPSKTIGINGLERASAALRLQNEVVLQSSFQDLEALMTRAKDLIALAEQLASKLASLPVSTSTRDARVALRESTELLGLSTPIVTKEIAGGKDAYLSELARQIAEFLTSTDSRQAEKGRESILKREGGIISLIDLFALYNRVRGVCTDPHSFPFPFPLFFICV